MNESTFPENLHPDWETLSSLIDGELERGASDSLLAALCRDPELRNEWVTLHIVGDALRSSEVAAVHSSSFCARVAAALEREPTVLAPRLAPPVRTLALRRYLAPGAAIAASAAVIAFVAIPLLQSPGSVGTVQQAAVMPVPERASPQGADAGARRAASTVANARSLDVYLAAHRELAAGVGLPRATPYLRTPGEAPESR